LFLASIVSIVCYYYRLLNQREDVERASIVLRVRVMYSFLEEGLNVFLDILDLASLTYIYYFGIGLTM